MSAADLVPRIRDPWWERGADRLNPILVKEARQALKSRQFVLTFLLLLLAAWSVSVFHLATYGAQIEYGSAGRDIFFWFYFVLAIATILVIPFGAYRSLLSERDLNTFDLLSISTLSPGKIVRGKLASAVLQLFIFYSAITPFMAFASLLNGFDTPTAAYILVASLLASVLLSTAALMFATLSRNRLWQGLVSLAVLAGLGVALGIALTTAGAIVHSPFVTFDDPDFWWITGALLMGGLSYFVLLQQITIAQLTFESDNRTTGIRLSATGQFLLLWATFAVIATFHRGGGAIDETLIKVLTALSALHWAAFGLFSVTEPDTLSHRVERELPRNPLIRALVFPWLPGGARGFLWVALNIAGVWCLAVAFCGVFAPARSGAATPWSNVFVEFSNTLFMLPHAWNAAVQFATALCCYLLIYLGIACLAGRLLRRVSTEIQPAHLRVMTILLVLAGTILRFLPPALGLIDRTSFSLVELIDPFYTSALIADGRSLDGQPVVLVLMAVATAVTLANVPGIIESYKAVQNARRGESRRRSDRSEIVFLEEAAAPGEAVAGVNSGSAASQE